MRTEPDITDARVFTVLRSYLLSFFPDVEVIRTQDNRVPPPRNGFIALTGTGKRRIETNWRRYVDTAETKVKDVIMPTEYAIQVDFYGKGAGEMSQAFCTLFFDDTSCEMFPNDVRPLYASDPVQMPMVSAEKQYMERWRVDIRMQCNPAVTVPQDFFDKADTQAYPIH